ncbi:MAG: hypothetical protein FJ303_11545 [Planctomycetes bacterium]|nr:hypothetical protein [Planctomycetota bacterium]
MWVKLTGEYVNLDHIVRVRVNKALKNGLTEWVVELEGIIKGELTYFTRYRGIDAEIVMHALEIYSRIDPAPAPNNQADPVNTTSTNTVHDVKIM